MTGFDTTHTVSLTEAMTISSALVAYALREDSTDDRIRSVIAALRAIDYTDTAATLEGLQADSSSVMRERIDAYSAKVKQ